jgi:hypothetical protein
VTPEASGKNPLCSSALQPLSSKARLENIATAAKRERFLLNLDPSMVSLNPLILTDEGEEKA